MSEDREEDTNLAVSKERFVLAQLAIRTITAEDARAVGLLLSQATAELFHWDAFHFSRRLPESDYFQSIYTVDTIEDRQIMSPGEQEPLPPPYLPLEPLRRGESLLINNEDSSPKPGGRFGDTSRQSESRVFVPIVFDGIAYGIVSVQSYTPAFYGKEHVGLLESVADIVAPALHRLQFVELLRRSQQQFRTLIEQSRAVPYERDLSEEDYIYLGDGIEALTGYTKEEFAVPLWRRITEEFIPHGLPEGIAPAEYARMYVKGEVGTWRAEVRIKAKDGSTRWLQDSSIAVYSPDGRRRRALGILSDVTEQKEYAQLQEVLLELARHLSAAATVEEAAEAVAQASQDLVPWDVCMIATYNEVKNKTRLHVMIDTIDGERVSFPDQCGVLQEPGPLFHRTLSEGAFIAEIEETSKLPVVRFGNPEQRSQSMLFAPIYADGRPAGVISFQSYTPKAYTEEHLGILRLLADYCASAFARTRALEALKASEERYREAISQANAVAYEKDMARGEFTFIGERIRDITGYSPSELTYDVWTSLIEESVLYGDVEGMSGDAAHSRLVDRKLTSWRGDYRLRKRNGEEVWVSDAAVIRYDEYGNPVSSLGILQDITYRKKSELLTARLQEFAVKLSSAENSKEAAEIAAQTADELIGWDSVYLGFHSKEDDKLIQLLSYDLVDGDRQEITDEYGVPAEVSPVVRRVMGGERILLHRGQADEIGTRSFGNKALRSQSLLYAPMRIEGKVIGVLSAQSYTPNRYDEADLQTLQFLADTCAAAIARTRLADELRIQQERYRQAIRMANAVPYEKDIKTGLLLYMGGGIQGLTGYTSEELTPPVWKQMVKEIVLHGDMANLPVEEAVDRSKKGAVRNWRADYRIETKDGQTRWMADSSTTLLDENGIPFADLGILQDITARMRTSEQILALSKLGQELGAAKTPREVALVVVNQLAELVGWDCCFLATYEEEQQHFEVILNLDTVDGQVQEFPSQSTDEILAGGYSGRTLREGPLIVLQDDEAPLKTELLWGNAARRSESMLFVPIREQGSRNVGVLSIQSYRRNAYTQADLKLVQVFADHCAGAMARTAAEERLRETRRRASIFASLAHRLNSAATLEEAGRIVADTADSLLGWDAFFIDVYSEEEQAVHNIVNADTVEGERIWYPPHTRVLSPVCRRLLEEGSFMVLRDPGSPEAIARPEGANPFGDESRLCLSLLYASSRHGNRTTGFLSVQSYSPKAYTEEDLETLDAIADHCAGALERLRIEHALALERTQLRTLIDNLPDAIFIKDTEGRFLNANKSMLEAAGMEDVKDLAGKTDHDFVPEPRADEFRQIDFGVLESGEPVLNKEEPVVSPGGSMRWVSTTKVPLQDEDGKIAGIVGISRDVTAEKRAHNRIAALAVLGRDLNAATEYREAGKIILDVAQSLIGWDACYATLYSKKEDLLIPLWAIDQIDGEPREITTTLFKGKPSGFTLKAIREGKLLTLREAGRENATTAFGDRSRPTLSLMHMPVYSKGKVLAVISIQSYRENAYDEDSLNLLETLAEHCAGALERLRVQEDLRRSEERYALATEATNDGLWDLDLLRDTIYYSPRFRELYGLRPGETQMGTKELFARVHPEDAPKTEEVFGAAIEGAHDRLEAEFRILHQDGKLVWGHLKGTVVRDNDRKPVRIVGSLTDITARRTAEDQLTKAAFYDSLTGLPNRSLFLDRLERCLTRQRRHPEVLFALLFLDLDRFKNVNDTYGHLAGDRLLQEVAARLQLAVRDGDTVARLGGDEFTIILDDLPDINQAVRVANRLIQELSQPFHINGAEIQSGTSIGIALSATGYDRVEDMLHDADVALYNAKELGRGRFSVFDKKLEQKAAGSTVLERDLTRSIEKGELVLHYQPVLSISTGVLQGFEALLRWNHPSKGMMSPGDFLTVAEKCGMAMPIGKWVLATACSQLAAWKSRVPKKTPLAMGVNLSASLIASPDLPAIVENIIAESRIDPGSLQLEINETAFLGDRIRIEEVLRHLRKIGVRISLDDFGGGNTPLAQLATLPIDYLKIDRSFVARLGKDSKNTLGIRAVIQMARILKLDVVAKGAETEAHMAQLRESGCDLVQGFLIARPLPAEEAEQFLLQNLAAQ